VKRIYKEASLFTGKQVRSYRRSRGLTQEQLASVLGISRAAIAKMEQENRVIRDIGMLKALQNVLGIPYNSIGFIPIEVFHDLEQHAKQKAAPS